MNYHEEAGKIWRNSVPPAGQSALIEGELIRCIEKLRDGAIRNGNMNWDKGFELIVDYLETHLLDATLFPKARIDRARNDLKAIRNYEEPILDDAPYDMLTEMAVDVFHHYGSRPNPQNPELHR